MKSMIALAAACLALVFASPALARPVIQPETGAPIVALNIPDDWTSRYDEAGNLLIQIPGGIAFSITVAADENLTADALALGEAALAHATVQRVGDVQLAGFSGGRFRGTLASNGVTLNVDIRVVSIGDGKVLSLTIVSHPSVAPQALDAAAAVLTTARVLR